jgi:hypothetical protein
MSMNGIARRCAGTLILAFVLTPADARAQGGGMPGMEGMQHAMPGPLGISMDRMASGTTWIPDAVPVPSYSRMIGSWMVMAHGLATLQYDWQGGPRGDRQIGSLNWVMLMASRDLMGGKIQPRAMLSLDPATVGDRGYPLLLQTGESHHGGPIHDRQHPHDFWMELGVLYEREITPALGVSIYAAPSGEPALGPVAFMHRPSALDLPFAPLSHHWQDATHISFGVVTAGLFGRRWKLEGSAFNGQEPDEHRWGFDAVGLNSWSGRLTVNPTPSLSLTAGFGRLDTPEALHPDESMHRVTASILYGRAGEGYRWSSAAVWGLNRPIGGEGQATSAVLLETTLTEGRSTLLARAEYVEKSAEELVVPPSAGILPERVFGVGSFSVGYLRDLGSLGGLTAGIGAVGTMSLIDEVLEGFYGSRNPRGGMVFLRVRPTGASGMDMTGMEQH